MHVLTKTVLRILSYMYLKQYLKKTYVSHMDHNHNFENFFGGVFLFDINLKTILW